ncbi:MAG TPA: hypothetical protein VET48_05400 [Steroidobacteraceae bacterium]|nr:hypothetical protein [Steroidobacteraceae bacterium]
MQIIVRRSWLLLIFGNLLFVVGACQPQSTSPSGSPPATPFKPTASIQEIMASIVDPAADTLWDSVGTTVNAKGAEDRQPRTEEEWQQVRRSAITLIESTNLLMMDGRRIVAVGGKLADEGLPGVLNANEAQQRLDAQHPAFVQFARALHDVGEEMLQAVDAKNSTAMVDVGSKIDEVCESCHTTFWYPTAAR